ncbi:MAG: pyridoxal phosphate-dependent aminotransferase [Acidobacteriota bacterium]
MTIRIQENIRAIVSPANLRINDRIKAYREECLKSGCERPYHHFAFGESPFSPPPTVIEALAANASRHSYLPSGGIVPLRERIAAYYNKRFDIDCGSEQVIVGPGSKEMIAATLTVLQGVLIVPTPSWVSYLPQARIVGKEVIPLRTSREDGFKVTPDLLAAAVEHTGSRQKILLLNHPNNPTGAVYSADELRELAGVCRRREIVVVSDEIYAQTTFDTVHFTSMARIYPEGTIVTGGLSKDRSCGGYRFGLAITPRGATELAAGLLKVAGSTYSCVAAPIQYAAMEAYSGKPEVEDHIRDCTKLHALAGRKMSSMLSRIEGVRTTVPHGAFYLYVDFNDQREQFKKLGMKTCEAFCENLLAQEHTALLPGNALLLAEDDFSVRCCFVDYDGDRALAAWRASPPVSERDEDLFAERYFPLMLGGVASIGRYLGFLREGTQPPHFDAPAWIPPEE